MHAIITFDGNPTEPAPVKLLLTADGPSQSTVATFSTLFAALNTLINLVCDNIIKPEEQIIDIAHADAYEDSLYIMDKIREKINIRDFINTSYDFCTGSHVGPDTIALFFIGKDRELVQS